MAKKFDQVLAYDEIACFEGLEKLKELWALDPDNIDYGALKEVTDFDTLECWFVVDLEETEDLSWPGGMSTWTFLPLSEGQGWSQVNIFPDF